MSLRTAGEIARFVRSKASGFGYTTTDDRAKPEALYALKDRLLSGPCDVRIFTPTRFEAKFACAYFNQAIRRDLFDGMARIKYLQRAASCLAEHDAATAWVLTTCYYTSFFAAIEILRCSGKVVSFFGDAATRHITQRALLPVPGRLESGTYEGSVTFDVVTREITVAYAKRSIRHHDFTWQQVKQIVTQTRKNLTGVDAVVHERLEQFVGSDTKPFWPSPSDTRNHWNYEDASLFGKGGERVGSQFRKLAKNRLSALNWGASRRVILCRESCASSVAFVMSVLVNAVEEVSIALLPDSLTRVLPKVL